MKADRWQAQIQTTMGDIVAAAQSPDEAERLWYAYVATLPLPRNAETLKAVETIGANLYRHWGRR